MKTIALLSGGKDSILAVLMAYRYGHEPAVAVNIAPALPGDAEADTSKRAQSHDIDSYMYQTVGFEAVEGIAACLNVPLRRTSVKRGSARDQSLLYSERPPEDDEVQSLFHLLKEVKEEFPEVRGLTSGAILSNYQRNRIEFICNRLGIESLAYLWMRQPSEILDMAHALSVRAILVKTASIGLAPHKLIGKTLEEAQPTLEKMTELYQSHLAGEGGEYETTVLNCPLFPHEQLIVSSLEVVMQDDNDISPSGHGVLTVRREKKSAAQKADEAQLLHCLRDGQICFPSDVAPLLQTLCTSSQELRSVELRDGDTASTDVSLPPYGTFLTAGATRPGVESQIFRRTAAVPPIKNTIVEVQSVVEACLDAAQTWATAKGLVPFYFHISLPHSAWEDACRAAYCAKVSHVCPPGLLVTARTDSRSSGGERTADNLPGEIILEVLAAPHDSIQRNVLHAQSRSCWALGEPGPYAQGRRVGLPSGDALLFVSATAGRVPATREIATAKDLPAGCRQRLLSFLKVEEGEGTSAVPNVAAEFLFAMANCQAYLGIYRRTLPDVTRATIITAKEVPRALLSSLWRWCVGEPAASFEQVCTVATVAGLSARERVRVMLECTEFLEK